MSTGSAAPVPPNIDIIRPPAAMSMAGKAAVQRAADAEADRLAAEAAAAAEAEAAAVQRAADAEADRLAVAAAEAATAAEAELVMMANLIQREWRKWLEHRPPPLRAVTWRPVSV